MMFRSSDRCWMMDIHETWFVKRWLQKSISPNDILRQFHGNPSWFNVVKVTPNVDVATDLVFYKTVRSYVPKKQKDEIIIDMFDISQSHRIVGLKYPWDIYLMECDSDHPDTNIDADMIEAIVGKVDEKSKDI